MPEMDGYETCARLKKMSVACDIPVIFISALAEITEKAQGFTAGAVDYITKPFEIAEVRARVATHLALTQTREALRAQNRRLEELSNSLAKYLSPQLYESIFSGRMAARTETRRRLLTVFFSDIVEFTPLVERSEPETVTSLLNDYLDDMSTIVLRHGGTIDKFMGDAILVFFGDPETKGAGADALACVRMAIEMRAHLPVLRRRWERQGLSHPMKVRMGINTGYCTVGNFGSADRLEYTIIGGNVNVANRLQSLADADEILVSQETFSLVRQDVIAERKGELKMKGISHPMEAYRLVGLRSAPAEPPDHIAREGEGFSLRVDFSKLRDDDRQDLGRVLRETLERL
jgi:class 3 adenylate cyclase